MLLRFLHALRHNLRVRWENPLFIPLVLLSVLCPLAVLKRSRAVDFVFVLVQLERCLYSPIVSIPHYGFPYLKPGLHEYRLYLISYNSYASSTPTENSPQA